jgi:2-keto-4-pentenoate hydratase/2-oxohepta-3-ene-1,7-dioic acid hydratase in catechol pathway
MARHLARTPGGRLLVSGSVDTDAADPGPFVPADALTPSLDDEAALLDRGAAGDLPSLSAAAVPPRTHELGDPLPGRRSRWGVGLNYLDHADDLAADPPDRPAFFLQPPASATGPGGPIRRPPADECDRVTAEAELGVVIGRECRDVAPADVPGVVAGVVPLIDVTAEDLVKANPRLLVRSKSYDGFLVAGPSVQTVSPVDAGGASALVDPATTVRTVVDGGTVAEGRVADMAFPPGEVVARLSRATTLAPGDLIATGTPGAGAIEPGDEAGAVVEGVGRVDARVVGPDW